MWRGLCRQGPDFQWEGACEAEHRRGNRSCCSSIHSRLESGLDGRCPGVQVRRRGCRFPSRTTVGSHCPLTWWGNRGGERLRQPPLDPPIYLLPKASPTLGGVTSLGFAQPGSSRVTDAPPAGPRRKRQHRESELCPEQRSNCLQNQSSSQRPPSQGAPMLGGWDQLWEGGGVM